MEAEEGSLCQLAVEPTRKLFWLPFIGMITKPSLLNLFNRWVSRAEHKKLHNNLKFNNLTVAYFFTSFKFCQKAMRQEGDPPPSLLWPVASLSQGPFSQCVHWAPKTPVSILLCREFPNAAFLSSLPVALWGSGQWNEGRANRCGAKVKR